MQQRTIRLLILFLYLQQFSLAQKNKFILEVKTGTPFNIPIPLTIQQEGFPDITIANAMYYSEPFISPIYWSARLGYRKGSAVWEIEDIHLKLFLKNKTEEIQAFSISHGYNLILLNRSREFNNLFILRGGAGIVLAHPESTIRNKKFDEEKGLFNLGYYVAGMALHGSLEKRIQLKQHLFFSVEIKVNPSYAEFPVAEGRARLWNINIQLASGFSYIVHKHQETK